MAGAQPILPAVSQLVFQTNQILTSLLKDGLCSIHQLLGLLAALPTLILCLEVNPAQRRTCDTYFLTF